MSIKVIQAWDAVDLELEQGSGTHSSSAATVHYIVSGATTDAEACEAAYTEAPEEYSSIPKKSVSVSERLTHDTWKIDVK